MGHSHDFNLRWVVGRKNPFHPSLLLSRFQGLLKDQQAEAVADALREANRDLVTKDDLERARAPPGVRRTGPVGELFSFLFSLRH